VAFLKFFSIIILNSVEWSLTFISCILKFPKLYVTPKLYLQRKLAKLKFSYFRIIFFLIFYDPKHLNWWEQKHWEIWGAKINKELIWKKNFQKTEPKLKNPKNLSIKIWFISLFLYTNTFSFTKLVQENYFGTKMDFILLEKIELSI
jgi:hypothetical protein